LGFFFESFASLASLAPSAVCAAIEAGKNEMALNQTATAMENAANFLTDSLCI
jgi:hypothetical protein